MSPEQLYELAKERYYKVYDFEPNTKKSDKRWIRVGMLPDVTKRIRWNFFDGEKLISEKDFDKADVFSCGRTEVVRDNKYNILKDDGTFVFAEWYDYVYECQLTDGQIVYQVEVKEDEYGFKRRVAFADSEGTVFSEWFDESLTMLHSDYHTVCRRTGNGVREKTTAVYDLKSRKIVSDWYDDITLFIGKQKFARIRKGETYNLIDDQCNLVFKEWSMRPVSVDETGHCKIYKQDGTVVNGDATTGEFSEII